jgi:hypothetical protein
MICCRHLATCHREKEGPHNHGAGGEALNESNEKPSDASQLEQEKPLKPHEKAMLILVFGVGVPFLIWSWTSGPDPLFNLSQDQSKAERQRDSDQEIEARAFAEHLVRQSLKAPSTAEFGPYSSVKVVPMGGDSWTVSGYVDAQNGFGAQIRSQWSVLLQKEGDRWRELSVDVN